MAKILRYRAIPEPSHSSSVFTALRWIPVYASEPTTWTGWKPRTRGEHGTNPAILPPMRAKVAKGKGGTIAVYSDGLGFRACESGARVNPELVRDKSRPAGKLWRYREISRNEVLPNGRTGLWEVENFGESTQTDYKGLSVEHLMVPAKPQAIGYVLGADNIRRPVDRPLPMARYR